MPVKAGEVASNDYCVSKELVNDMVIGEGREIEVVCVKRVQKYVYEIGLKCKPRREFKSKKLSESRLKVWRVE